MTGLRDALAQGARRLSAAGIESARIEARVLLAAATGMSADEVATSSRKLAPAQLAQFESFIARRQTREPSAYITGMREFWSLPFAVGPGVLIPRPETETLVEEALRTFPDRSAPLRMLDLGTGSGCILISALTEFPNAGGVGLDRSEIALGFAARNAERRGVSARTELRLSDWSGEIDGRFDAIFSNPPYIAAGDIPRLDADVAAYEPHGALDGGADGLEAYRTLGPRIRSALNPDGWAFVELGAGQAAAVKTIFESSGLEVGRIAPDLSGIERCIAATRRA
ncbi:MAG TPA: peptide chain release factor N(5)-glutamine methyltransferase [Rhizomicrobium sp.]|nr:peptide chain release factor N(5)-glutamine methyltransferase [Rhizomicrobium sp.]